MDPDTGKKPEVNVAFLLSSLHCRRQASCSTRNSQVLTSWAVVNPHTHVPKRVESELVCSGPRAANVFPKGVASVVEPTLVGY